MQYIYIVNPKNPNLNHCSDSFYEVLKNNRYIDSSNCNVNYISFLDNKKIISIGAKLANLEAENNITLFLFALQFDYLVLSSILRIISKLFSKNLKIIYLMHEPKYERGRINPIKASLVYYYNLLFAKLSDKILISSDEALNRAKEFVELEKIVKVNLTFLSESETNLQKNLLQLKLTWNNYKVFSLLGTIAKDKNPQGFISLVNLITKHYSDQARFIRGGRDRGIDVDYSEKIIIKFPGYMTNSGKVFLLNTTHFLVVPYFFSTQSGVIVEGLKFGKILIVNDIPAFAYLKELKSVFMVNFNDESALLQCINHLFSMNVSEYEFLYWESVKYFQKHHSDDYLSKIMNKIV
ncbi:MAG: hypothetical protein H9536_00515 [Aphanizomenon flos-aquae Clear-A1]|jgi:hypothetical protein|nr:hypothetical protein [Aphanizomenon flos-aquae Clear-A1]